jgi:hypothetical protein
LEIQLGDILTVNHCSCREVRQSLASGLLIFSALAALVLPVRAHAQLTGSASASSQYASNSNLFASDTGNGQPGANGSQGSVSSFGYGASANGNYKWSRQSLYVTASVSQSDYQGHLDLNHYEYSIGTGLKWQLADFLDGGFDVSRTQAMVPFLDLTGSGSGQNLVMQSAQTETMNIGLKISSEWKLAGSASTSTGTQFTAGESDKALRQTTGTTSLEYAGIGPLTTGLTGTYSSGDSGGSDVAKDPSYTQTSAGFLANYNLSRTSFNGQVTYSWRSFSGASDTLSGLTGSLGFNDQLTQKTSFSVNISRSINTQYLNLGSEIDSNASLAVTWKATTKIGVSLGYSFSHREFPAQAPGQVAQGDVGGDTSDNEQGASLNIGYSPVHWLSIATYANVQTRSSNTAGRDFNSTTYGISVIGTVGTAAK